MKYLIMAMYFFMGKPVSFTSPMPDQSKVMYQLVDVKGNQTHGTWGECLAHINRNPKLFGGQ